MNILIYNFKGGCSKSTTSSIVASYLSDATLIEVDFINQSDRKINSQGFYESIQVNFNDENSDSFYEFENFLLKSNTKVIDVGSVMLDKAHQALKNSDLYSTIDLVIIPAMDGVDDFEVAMKFLANVKDEISPEKIMFGFNRFNKEYETPQEQFDSFFLNQKFLKNEFKIDISNEDNWFVIEDSRSIKKARSMRIPFKSLVDEDVQAIIQEQRAAIDDDEKRMLLTKRKGLVQNAQKLYQNYISQMMEKIIRKLEK
jgi:hypothetical protein